MAASTTESEGLQVATPRRRRRAALALWLVGLTLAGCNRQEREIVELINGAVVALESGNSTQARGKLLRVQALDPSDPDAAYYLGSLALHDGDSDGAERLLMLSLARDPLRPAAHLDLARARYARRDDKGALQAVQGLLALDPGHPDGHTLVGRIAARAGDRDSQDKALRAAIAGDAGHAAAYLLLSDLYSDVGANKAALDVLNEGLKFSPDDVGLQESLGIAWLGVGRPDRAAEVFAIAAQNPRADWTTHINHGAALVQIGDRAKAIDALQRGLLMGRGRGDKAALEAAARIVLKLRRGQKADAPDKKGGA